MGVLREKGGRERGISRERVWDRKKRVQQEARGQKAEWQHTGHRWGGEGPEERTLRHEPRGKEEPQGPDMLSYNPLIPPRWIKILILHMWGEGFCFVLCGFVSLATAKRKPRWGPERGEEAGPTAPPWRGLSPSACACVSCSRGPRPQPLGDTKGAGLRRFRGLLRPSIPRRMRLPPAGVGSCLELCQRPLPQTASSSEPLWCNLDATLPLPSPEEAKQGQAREAAPSFLSFSSKLFPPFHGPVLYLLSAFLK